MLSDYRPAVAGSIVTILTWAALEFAGVDIPGFVGGAIATLVIFLLGFVPKPKPDPPADA